LADAACWRVVTPTALASNGREEVVVLSRVIGALGGAIISLAAGALIAACADAGGTQGAPTGPNAQGNGCSPDVTAPAITSLSASPSTLWPPNHKFVPVTVAVTASDNCTQAPVCAISAVASNEPVNGIGDGNTAPDWVVTGSNTLLVRAERAGPGSGRIYTVAVTCRDAAGNATTGTTTVFVPHDQGVSSGGNGGDDNSCAAADHGDDDHNGAADDDDDECEDDDDS
jgi:hypothetical protein